MSDHDIDPQAAAQVLYPEAQPQADTASAPAKAAEATPNGDGPQSEPVSHEHLRMAAEQAAQSMEKNRSKAIKVLQQRWGGNYQRNLDLANKAVGRFGGQALVDELAGSGKGLDPATIQAWYRVGQALSEDSFVSGEPGRAATRDIAKILYDKS